MLRMRTIPQLVREIKAQDPQTPISEPFLRKLVKQNKIPYITANRRVFISVEAFETWMQNPEPVGDMTNKILALHNIRKIVE